MQLKDVMTTEVERLAPTSTIEEAAVAMARCHVGALPVCEDDRPVGILTDRDITVRAIAQGRDPHTTPIRDIMTTKLIACPEDEDVEEAAHIMGEQQIRRVIVVDHRHRLAGIVSLGDLAVNADNVALAGETLEEISQPSDAA